MHNVSTQISPVIDCACPAPRDLATVLMPFRKEQVGFTANKFRSLAVSVPSKGRALLYKQSAACVSITCASPWTRLPLSSMGLSMAPLPIKQQAGMQSFCLHVPRQFLAGPYRTAFGTQEALASAPSSFSTCPIPSIQCWLSAQTYRNDGQPLVAALEVPIGAVSLS